MQKISNRNYLKAFFMALFAGTIWSFGALIVRHLEAAESYQWQYLFFRGLMVAFIISIYLMAREGFASIGYFSRIGLAGLLGAVGLMTAMSGYILSITLTTVANTLLMLAAAPFIAAFIGIILLKEKVRYATWVSMGIGLSGILVMVLEGLGAGTFLGNLFGLMAAFGMAVFSVCLRWRRQTPQFATIALAGAFCVLFSLLVLFFRNDTLIMPLGNIYLSMLHGIIVAFGLILFSLSAKFLPAAELILLSRIEVVGGILLVYLPIFGIHEIPSLPTVVGGIILLGALVFDGLSVRLQAQMSPDAPS